MDGWYSVWRNDDGHFIEIAQCRYIESAQKVLSDWHSGKITRDGKLIKEKNLGA